MTSPSRSIREHVVDRFQRVCLGLEDDAAGGVELHQLVEVDPAPDEVRDHAVLVADERARRRGDRTAVADDRIRAAAREHRERVGVGLVGAHEVEHEIRTAATRELAHGIDRSGSGDDLTGAELGRQRAAARVRVDRDGRARAELVQELECDVPDAADADHGRRRARHREVGDPADRVVRREPRVGVRCDGRRLDAFGQAQERALGHDDVVGEAAVDRQARELVMGAVHVVAAPAGDAEAAAVGRVHEHRIALRDRRDAVADLLDPARVLVAEHPRQPHADVLHQALDGVEIGRAHARAADPDDDVGRVRDLGHRPLDELERPVVFAHQCRFHGSLLGLAVAVVSKEVTSSCR